MRARKEEERKAKEEERRKREAERAREEEEKRRKMEKQRALLMGFFVQQKPENSTTSAAGGGRSGDCGVPASPFMQFELKRDQRQSPICRVRSEALRHAKWQNVEDLRLSWQSGQSSIDGSRLGLVKFGQ